MKIRINRIYGNADFTIGIATIDGYKFRCYTLERRSADHSRAANKRNNHAVPCGEYKFNYQVTTLSPMTPVSFVVKGYGRVKIVKKTTYADLATGEIALFSNYPDMGSANVDQRIYSTLERMSYADASLRNNEDCAFIISEADEFYYDEAYHNPANDIADQDFIDTEYDGIE